MEALRRRREHEISALATVARPRGEIFEFLEDLDNQWTLLAAALKLERIAGPAGAPSPAEISLHGPLGLHRVARIRLIDGVRPALMTARVEIGNRTSANIEWALAGKEGRTRVTLRATAVRLSIIDRVLLMAGGKRRLRGVADSVLQALRERCEPGGAAWQPARATPKRVARREQPATTNFAAS